MIFRGFLPDFRALIMNEFFLQNLKVLALK